MNMLFEHIVESENLEVIGNPVDHDICFYIPSGREVLRIAADGRFYVNGREVTEDAQIYNAMVRFLAGNGMLAKETDADHIANTLNYIDSI